MALDKVRSTVKYPTTLIINGLRSGIALELADSLLDQGGYVIIVDTASEDNIEKIERLGDTNLLSFVDHSEVSTVEEDLRRLDYVFYFGHEAIDLTKEISTQSFLEYSNFLDQILTITNKFEAKFLLTTSVKAHQLIMASKEMELNFGTTADKKHTIYTEMELQRYAESLVMEYIQKVGTDARIIRIAEIIGDGMDYADPTPFTKMVLAAVQGEKLPVYQDGLNSEWYIHILDAVYGLIKAQFSRNTQAEIYTLSYEDSYSDLSIAYKIHELEPEAGEIEFVDEPRMLGGNLPPIKLYKPAQNLSSIGWKPKIVLDEAIEQSLAGAKLFFAQKTASEMLQQNERTSGSANKLLSFLSLAKTSKEDDEVHSPLDQLLNERRTEENLRDESIANANKMSKRRKRQTSNTFAKRVSNSLWSSFLWMRSKFSFIGDMTPSQFVFWIIFSVIFLVVYFSVISPTVVLARNYFLARDLVNSLENDYKNNQYENMTENLNELDVIIVESSQIITRYSWLANIFALQEEYATSIELLDAYHNYISGFANVSKSLDPFTSYLGVYTDSTFFRPNSESYLAIETSYDYSDYLRPLADNKGIATAGEEKMNSAMSIIKKTDISGLPFDLFQYVDRLNNKLSATEGFASYADIVEHAPQFMGVNEARTYLVLLLDNSKYTPIGGSISAYMLITLQNGSVSQVRVQSIDAVEWKLDTLNNLYKNLASATQFGSQPSFDVQDLTYISDYNDFALATKQVWETTFNRTVDGVVTINYSALEEFISQIDSISDTSVSVEGVEFNGINLLNNFKLMQSQNQSIERRNDLSAQLLANLADQVLSNLNNNFINYTKSFASFHEKKDLQASLYNMSLGESLEQASPELSNTDFYIKPLIVADERIVNPEKFPAVNYATQVTIESDLSLKYFFKAKFPAVDNIDSFVLCLPVSALEVTSVNNPITSIVNNSLEEKCTVVNITSETEIAFTWRVLSVDSLANSEYNLILGLYKQPGINIISDYELQISDTLDVVSIMPEVNLNANQIVFTEDMVNNRYINILLKK